MKFSTRFAEACYNQNSINELETALNSAPDAKDMRTWEITEEQYFVSIREALTAKKSELEQQ